MKINGGRRRLADRLGDKSGAIILSFYFIINYSSPVDYPVDETGL